MSEDEVTDLVVTTSIVIMLLSSSCDAPRVILSTQPLTDLNSSDLVTDVKVTITTKQNQPVFSLKVLFAYVGHTEASVLN